MENNLKLGYDVVVVGAGAAGCSFVNNISDKYRVLLVDQRKFPRFKACSGVLVNNSKSYFADVKLPKEVLSDPVELNLTYQDWDQKKENPVEKHFINTNRKELDNWLFSKTKKENVTFSESTKLVDFFHTKNKEFLVLMLENGCETKSIITKYLVACDGALSNVRRKLFPKEIDYYVAIQELIPGNKLDRAYFIFDSEITDFYGWVIPKGNLVEVGVAVSPVNSKEKFKLFKKKVEEKFGIKGSGEINSAVVLRPKSIGDIFLGTDHIFVCGEAAGLISPSSAEGISFALLSGKFCAQALNSDSKTPLTEYKNNCRGLLDRLETKFEKSRKISNIKRRKNLF